MASMEENTLLIWPLVAWWEATRASVSIVTRKKKKKTQSATLRRLTRHRKPYGYLPTSYRRQCGKATAARHPGGEEHICVNLWQVQRMQQNASLFNCLYLPLVSCSSEDTVYPVDDGKLNLLFLELITDVLQRTKVHTQFNDSLPNYKNVKLL